MKKLFCFLPPIFSPGQSETVSHSAIGLLKRGISLLFLILTVTELSAQITRNDIVGNPRYIWGEGEGKSSLAADNAAKAEISDQIRVRVTSDFSIDVKKSEGGKEQRNVEAAISTWSSATLVNCHKLVLDNGPKKFRVLRYIEVSEIERSFKEREHKITEMLKIAEKAELELRFDTALKYYYWALQLCMTLQRPSSHKYNLMETDRQVTTQLFIPERIHGIFDGLEFSFGGYSSGDRTLGVLSANYKGRPVTSLDYCYWDGIDWSALTSAKEGKGPLEFRVNSPASSVNVKVEYAFENEAAVDPELKSILEYLEIIQFSDSYFDGIKLETKSLKNKEHEFKVPEAKQMHREFAEAAPAVGAASAAPRSSMSELSASGRICRIDDSRKYISAVNQVLDAIESGRHDEVKPLFNEQGWDIYDRIIKYGKARILERPELCCLEFDGEIQCRAVPMQFSFPNSNRKFTENVVFFFDEESGLVSYLNFALNSVAVNDILRKSAWEDVPKLTLINFLENYRTAFALKRLEYISSIFADEAVIITGRIVKTKTGDSSLPVETIEYTKYNKNQYMDNLRRSFNSKEYINVCFASTEVQEIKGKDIYAVRLKQDYWSSNYSDSGYLLLCVDFQDYRKPEIYFRSWNPKTSEEDWNYVTTM